MQATLRAGVAANDILICTQPDWRRRLGVPYVELRSRLEVGPGHCSDTWAEQELVLSEPGDLRRSARLVGSAALVARTMGKPQSARPEREPAAVRGYWRFMENTNEREITPEKILAPHRERTIERMRAQETVFCVQDGTDINQTSAEARGVHLHVTLALNGKDLPLGVVRLGHRKKQPEQRPAPGFTGCAA